jgi:tryptophan-rich sensory protein
MAVAMVEVLRFLIITGTPPALGLFSGSAGQRTAWYDTLVKPSFTPPPWVFGIVWPILYICIGLAAYLASSSAWSFWILYFIQLALNLLFSPIMFRLQNLWLAAVVVTLTFVFALATTVYYWIYKHYLSVGLMIPYLFWLLFANILAWSFVHLNKKKIKTKEEK